MSFGQLRTNGTCKAVKARFWPWLLETFCVVLSSPGSGQPWRGRPPRIANAPWKVSGCRFQGLGVSAASKHRSCLLGVENEHGTCKAVKARFWRQKSLKRFEFYPLRSEVASRGGGHGRRGSRTHHERYSAKSAHLRQSRPNSDLGCEVEVLKIF